jgi:hypothetical protein
MSRRTAVPLIASIALTGCAQTQKTHYSVKIVFMNHSDLRNLDSFFAEVDAAEKVGKPYELILYENAISKASNYVTDGLTINGILIGIKKNYESLLKNGMSAEEAEELSKINSRGSFPGRISEFLLTFFVRAAIRIRGKTVLSLEAYSGEDYRMISEDMARSNLLANKFGSSFSSGTASLKELVSERMEVDSSMLQNAQERRDRLVIQNLVGVLDTGTGIFSDLTSRKEMKAIGFMGLSHQNAHDSSDERLSLEKEVLADIYSIEDQLISKNNSAPRLMTRREAYLTVIDTLYTRAVIKDIAVTDPNRAKGFVNKALALTEEDLDKLSDDTAKITDFKKRQSFILNRIIGYDAF